MATYPRIDSPCPLRFASLPGAGGFDCSQCQRHVHNLSAMSATERSAFLASCDDSVCVSYVVPRAHPRASAAWALAATVLVTGSALVQAAPAPTTAVTEASATATTTTAAPTTLREALAQISGGPVQGKGQPSVESVMLAGGVSAPRSARQVEFADDPSAAGAPELPVVADEQDSVAPGTVAAAAPTR